VTVVALTEPQADTPAMTVAAEAPMIHILGGTVSCS
jgi:hypothetical protein